MREKNTISAPATPVRPRVKRTGVTDALRDAIIAGKYQPGQQIPPVRELEKLYKASRVTVHRAVQDLKAEKFLYSTAGHGTRVVNYPPHLWEYGVVLHGANRDNVKRWWSNLFDSLMEAARRIEAEDSRRKFIFFQGLFAPLDTAPYRDLLDRLQSNRLAGLIFPTPPFFLQGHPPLQDDGIPRVVVDWHPPNDNASKGNFDKSAFYQRAFQFFSEKGCKRLACIMPIIDHVDLDVFTKELNDVADNSNMVVEPNWVQGVSAFAPSWTRHLVRFLFQKNRFGEDALPDALLINDDNLVEPVTSVLKELKIRVPEELHVVAHANYPVLPKAHVPVEFLGYDLQDFLRHTVKAIDANRRGGVAMEDFVLKPFFKEELLDFS
jgi:DNA-binding LacI/PurR family transcriptional regulator